MPRRTIQEPTPIERVVASVGSTQSLVFHSVAFAAFFCLAIFQILSWELMLLVLTTILSLEAIYLAIFIQITVNKHTQSLKEVEEDIEEISEDIEELGEDMEDIQEDLEEISEDIEEISEDMEEIQEDIEEMSEEDAEERQKNEKTEKEEKSAKPRTKTKKVSTEDALEQLSKDMARVLKELEVLKKRK